MSQEISGNNTRIARNTLTLYIRTFVTMIVGLYTGRVMLETFGVDNYSGGDSGYEFAYYRHYVCGY